MAWIGFLDRCLEEEKVIDEFSARLARTFSIWSCLQLLQLIEMLKGWWFDDFNVVILQRSSCQQRKEINKPFASQYAQFNFNAIVSISYLSAEVHSQIFVKLR